MSSLVSLSRPRRLAVAVAISGLLPVLIVGGFFADRHSATPPSESAHEAVAHASVGAPIEVPASLRQVITSAASTCPELTAPRLAGQLMANSRFDAEATTRGGQGIAGLTEQAWKQWKPWPNAQRSDATASIVALAHYMCELVGKKHSAGAHDPWRLALASFFSGVTITDAGQVSPQASYYASTVMAYSAWYERYLPFGGLRAGPTNDFVDHPPAPPRAPDDSTSSAAPSPDKKKARPAPKRVPPAPPAAKPRQPVKRPVPAPPKPRARQSEPPPKPPVRPAQAPSVSAGRSAYSTIQAESYDAQSGAKIENCSDAGNGKDMGYLAPGDWLAYGRINFGGTGATKVHVRFASGLPDGLNGRIEIRLDSIQANPVGSVAIAGTGGWQNWTTVAADIARVKGEHTVLLTFVSPSWWEIGNINWFTFKA